MVPLKLCQALACDKGFHCKKKETDWFRLFGDFTVEGVEGSSQTSE